MYFDDMTKLEDFNLDNILIDEKSHKSILIYDISYKILACSKPLHIRFDKIDGFSRIYDGIKYLTLFGFEMMLFTTELDIFWSLKSGITYIFSHCFAQIIVSYDYVTIEKILTLHNVITHIKSVLNKDKNHYYYKIFFEKCSCQLVKGWSHNFFL